MDIPVCDSCMLTAKINANKQYPYVCRRCGDYNLHTSLYEYIPETQELIYQRTLFFEKNRLPTTNMNKIIEKPFLLNGKDPHERYYSWLIAHIGKQGVDWDWNLPYTDSNLIQLGFNNRQDALLFELSNQ